MVTIVDVIQYFIRKQSEIIHQLKTESVTEQIVEKYFYVSPDGKCFRNSLAETPEGDTRWRWEKVKQTKLVGQISPKHPQWKNYRIAKRQASLLLIARRILKLNQNILPELKQVRDMVKIGFLTSNLGKRHRAFCIRAFRYLRKLNNRLTHSPERFEAVEVWVNQNRSKREGR